MWVRSNWLNAVAESLPCVIYIVILCTYCFVWYCIVINVTNLPAKLINFETNVSDKSFIEEQRFEAIMASLSSSNNKYR